MRRKTVAAALCSIAAIGLASLGTIGRAYQQSSKGGQGVVILR